MKLWLFITPIFLMQITTGLTQSDTLSPEHAKYQRIYEVYETLTRSWESFKPAPKLEVYKKGLSKKYLAQYIFSNLGNSRILLDEEIYDLCVKEFGAKYQDALACILAHELAHHYRYHKASPGFLRDEPTDSLEQEADFFGLFQAYVAGYDSYTIFPDVLNLIYGSYLSKLSTNKYVPKERRIRQAKSRIKTLVPVIDLVRMGNTLLLAEKYSLAETCFKNALEVLPSKEIFNNLGLSILLDISSQMNLREMGFSYPFEIAPVQRLEEGLGRGLISTSNNRKEYIQRRLSKASSYFEKANTIDPFSSASHVNLAACLILMGYPESALAELNSYQRTLELEGISPPGNIFTLRGIAEFEKGNLKRAGEKFQTAFELKATYSDYNLKLFRASSAETFSWTGWRDQLLEEMKSWGNFIRGILYTPPAIAPVYAKPDKAIFPIGWNNLPSLRNQLHTGTAIASPNGSSRLYSYDTVGIRTYRLIYPKAGPNQQNYIFELMYTLKGYVGQTEQKIIINASPQAVVNTYGQPIKYVVGPDGSFYYIYHISQPERGMILEFRENELKGWTIFRNRPFFF